MHDMRSDTHKITFTFILDECEGSPTETLQDIVDILFEDPMKRNLGHLMRATTQVTACEVGATDGLNDYNWEVVQA